MNGKYRDLFRRGSDLSDLDWHPGSSELVQPGGQSSAQGIEPDLVQPDAGVVTQGNDPADELVPTESQIEEMAVGDAGHTSLVRLWNHVLNTMQVIESRHEFNTWVRRTSLLSIANGVVTVGAPSAFNKEGFENRYLGAVRDLISDLYVPVNQVRVVITGAGSQPANGLPSSV